VRLAGEPHSLTLGSPDLGAYLGPMRFFGCVVAPVANRIGGASATIDGVVHRFEANFGPHTLHSGSAGTQGKVWRVTAADERSVAMQVDMVDGEGGFPGHRTLRATWAVSPPATLTLTLDAVTDRPTPLLVAHHPYWNLDGSEDWEGHALQVAAERYLPADAIDRPTGEVATVGGTPFDFRAGCRIPWGPKLDNSLVLSDRRRPLTPVATLTGASGLGLDIATTEPALHLYDGHGAAAPGVRGHDGRHHGPCAGVALEPQFWPDAMSHPHFPDVILRPDAPWTAQTRYTFR
jgi:aldose 1-epimerase